MRLGHRAVQSGGIEDRATRGGDKPRDRRRALHSRPLLDSAGNINAEVAPFGVDVSSGVEERPGVKSPAAIARFVAAARSAILDPTRLDRAVPESHPQSVPTRR